MEVCLRAAPFAAAVEELGQEGGRRAQFPAGMQELDQEVLAARTEASRRGKLRTAQFAAAVEELGQERDQIEELDHAVKSSSGRERRPMAPADKKWKGIQCANTLHLWYPFFIFGFEVLACCVLDISLFAIQHISMYLCVT